MAKVALNKSSLARETAHLQEFQRFLPSLEMKRLQIIAARVKAVEDLLELQESIDQRYREAARKLPMLANRQVPVENLVRLQTVERSIVNLSGTSLPQLGNVSFETQSYPFLGRPHWVEPALEEVRELARLELECRVTQERLEELKAAEVTVSRRVNLFEKVLIPQAEANIRRIRMALADGERDAVIRAKIAKRKTAARAAEERVAEL